MAKKGAKRGGGMISSDKVTPEELLQNGKESQSTQRSMGYIAGLDLGTERPKGRAYTWMYIDGDKVKKYITERDLKHVAPDQIFYEGAITENDKKVLDNDFKMPPIE
jgi:hypothetical protein